MKELSGIGDQFEREWPQMIWREELVKATCGYYPYTLPDQYRGFSVAGVKGVGGKTVYFGGRTGTVIFLSFPDK
jgi:hypothetical protein